MKLLLSVILFILNVYGMELITPNKDVSDYDMNKALLGKKLFYDTRFSKDNTISCASCHDIYNGGDDNKAYSIGVENKLGNINAPTVLNSRYNFVQFWDGRAKSLADQVHGPIHNPIEMDSNFKDVILKLKRDKELYSQFMSLYGSLDENSITDAIVQFENALITPNSKFDRYLQGLVKLDDDEMEGLKLFKDYGCISCHNGINIGGNLYQKMGVAKPYNEASSNKGRFNVTNNKLDMYYFKVPTLRNIEHTSPYLHDGSVTSLKDVITIMLEYQVGLKLEDEKVEKLEKFLKTLSGEIPKIMAN